MTYLSFSQLANASSARSPFVRQRVQLRRLSIAGPLFPEIRNRPASLVNWPIDVEILSKRLMEFDNLWWLMQLRSYDELFEPR